MITMRDMIQIVENISHLVGYRGTPEPWAADNRHDLELDEIWFSTDPGTAKAFARDRARIVQHNPRQTVIYLTRATLAGRFLEVDPAAEARLIATQIGEPEPKDWDEIAGILQWGTAQKQWLDEARDGGYDGVVFHNVGDSPTGGVSSHIAVFHPQCVNIIDTEQTT